MEGNPVMETVQFRHGSVRKRRGQCRLVGFVVQTGIYGNVSGDLKVRVQHSCASVS